MDNVVAYSLTYVHYEQILQNEHHGVLKKTSSSEK